MKLINLTPHDIHIMSDGLDNQKQERLIPASGQCARCEMKKEWCGEIDGIPLYQTAYGKVQGLPEPKEGIYYMVSTIVAEACKGQRNDLLVPFDFVRDESGNIIGCKALSKMK